MSNLGIPSVTVNVQGSLLGATPDQIVQAPTPVIIKQLKNVQARTIQPLLGK